MATMTPVPMLDSSQSRFPQPATPVMETFHAKEKVAHPAQSRSSSLSDIEDRADEDAARSEQDHPASGSDQNDTEAETERLENSPRMSRKTQNLVLTSTNSVHELNRITPRPTKPIDTHVSNQVRPVSDAASPSTSSVGDDQTVPTAKSPRKRKRSDVEDQKLQDQRRPRDSRFGSSVSSNDLVSSRFANLEVQPVKSKIRHEASDREEEESEGEFQGAHTIVPLKGARVKRRNRKPSDDDTRMHSSSGSANGVSESMVNAGAPDSNEDDAEMDDAGEHAGTESPAKDEESFVKKKSAMDSLSAIEKYFGSLREKLYDERLASCDAELAMLAGPTITHPALLSMKAVLDQRREEKIQYENKLLKYKLGCLENKSKAEKAQVHGQYMQSVREIRDQDLEQANKKWYQIHKERRSRDDDVPEYTYQFPTRRSQQIISQTAYNKEVSLLSGIAKYRGFPAAPELCGAKPSEIDSDFEKMGIAQQPSATSTRHPPSLRANLSSTAVFPRPKAFADEHFLEQNPWANPQHPAHLHRQASTTSRAVSPLVAPALQRQPIEPNRNAQAVSAHLEAESRPYFPSRFTLAPGQQDGGLRKVKLDAGAGTRPGARTSTPNRLLPPVGESLTTDPGNQRDRSEKPKVPPMTASEKTRSPGVGRSQGQDSHIKSRVPNKMPRETDSPSLASESKLPASPSSRLSNIKDADITHLPNQSPAPQQYHRPVSVNLAAHGAGDRFTTS
ncbi:MAG: hypothetical protein Q9216_001001 [Gyalolechia sp. 2 TL-2023]